MLRPFAFLLLAAALPAQQPALDPDAAGPAQRIWSQDMQEEQQLWLRRRFTLPDKVTSARLVFTCDNECVVSVNGNEVARADDWEEVHVVDLEGLGRDNVIAIEATNTGGPAALACWLLWTDANGTAQELVTDPQWRVSATPADGWDKPAFDDKAWQPAVANFTSTYGLNLYNGTPRRVRFHSRFAVAADAIVQATAALSGARSREAALEALDAIERAVMEARRRLWAEKDREKEKEKEKAEGRGR